MALHDCKGLAPQINYRPVYHPCWGMKPLPQSLQFEAGPSYRNPGYTGPITEGWPDGQVITGAMAKVCGQPVWGYSNFNFQILFAWTRGGYPAVVTPDQPQMYPDWNVGNSSAPQGPDAGVTGSSGSCSLDAENVTRMSFRSTISNGLVSCPVTVTYEG
jgi:hypothetical protein